MKRLLLLCWAWGLSSAAPALPAPSSLGCGPDGVPLLVRSGGALVCRPSPCLAAANVSCRVSDSPCSAPGLWMASVELRPSLPPSYTCCSSPNFLRSRLLRQAPVLPGHIAALRGFQIVLDPEELGQEPPRYQFGEILTDIFVDDDGTTVLEVARFKCGTVSLSRSWPTESSYDYYGDSSSRTRRAAHVEPLDKPACDSEWDSVEVPSPKLPHLVQ